MRAALSKRLKQALAKIDRPGTFCVSGALPAVLPGLVLVLPSSHLGGELIVRHEGQERVIDFGGSAQAAFQVQYAAFYADCEHEVRPVEHGHRLCLVYNLTLAKAKKRIAAPRSAEHV